MTWKGKEKEPQKCMENLYFDPRVIQQVAQDRLGYAHLIKIFLKQAWTENRLRFKKCINFRKRENALAVEAYCEMDLEEFEGINARQQWANWRTIPKNLNGILPNAPVAAIDLCCGTGHSTEVLACYLPVGSSILGLEYNPSFVQKAQKKKYFHRSGRPCQVNFRVQSVLESFCDVQGKPISTDSIDLVNSCGAVGCHFDSSTTKRLVEEVARVTKPGGFAMIDSGLPGTNKEQLIQIFKEHKFKPIRFAKSCIFDLYTQICFVKEII